MCVYGESYLSSPDFSIGCVSSILVADHDVTIYNISQQVFRIDVIQVVISYNCREFRIR